MIVGQSRVHFYWLFLMGLYFTVVSFPFGKTETFCQQGVFHRMEEGNFLTIIISEHYVSSWLNCGQHCLQRKTCVGFKYQSPKKRHGPNCQIGGKLQSSSQNDVTKNTDGDWMVYKLLDVESPQCLEKNHCKNGGKCVGNACEEEGYKCECTENYSGKFCEKIPVSCKSIIDMNSNARNGTFKIMTETPGGFSNVYCQMTSLSGCSGGGWTMVMKIDGKKDTFRYNSSYWSNNSSYNPNGGLTAFDDQETKLASFWSTPFEELCVGMKVGDDRKFVSIKYNASSLYSLFADGKYRGITLGREKWKSLISNSSLQYHCSKEGFNIALGTLKYHVRVRLGIVGNEQKDCDSPDSFLGFGGKNGTIFCYNQQPVPTICGNLAFCTTDNGDKDIKAMGYILVR